MDGSNAASQPGGDANWDEAKMEQAMQRLDQLHVKARLLRETIPKMLEPLVQKHATPNSMYAAFTKSVNDAQADVTEFTEAMRDQESKEIFAQVQKSRQQDPMGIKTWRHKDHPDWFNTKS